MTFVSFLKQRAVNLIVGGTYRLPNWYDCNGKLRRFACRTSRVSPFRMTLDVPVVSKPGEEISAYFPDFGELHGTITDTTAGGMLVELTMDARKRSRMSDQLTWLERKHRDSSLKDARGAARIVPASPHSMLTLADGRMYSCFVIDVSITGAAVSADLQPAIGTPIAVGACVGRVVRALPHGFAVQFVEQQSCHEVERLIASRARKEFDDGKPEDDDARCGQPPIAIPETQGQVAFLEI